MSDWHKLSIPYWVLVITAETAEVACLEAANVIDLEFRRWRIESDQHTGHCHSLANKIN